MITQRSRAVHSASVEVLARRVREGLGGAGSGTPVADHLRAAAEGDGSTAAGHAGARDGAPGPVVAAGAVRLLGPDAVAGYLLAGRSLPAPESQAVRLALSALPPAPRASVAVLHGGEGAWLRAWTDWGLVTALAGVDATQPPVPAPVPPGPPVCDDRLPRRHRTGGAAEGGSVREGWVAWSLRMGQLASLALPQLDGPVHDAARGGVLGLARGTTRALLRGDFATAARLNRWLAWLAADGSTLPVDAGVLGAEIALRGGGERCLLDVAIANRMLEGERAWTRK
ncbi:hypothetical protein [Streptomyces coeruleorubidus]|uniref:hypothetical protein n=1 Tax=Streptomyces coeruleorubidus TaxID=116188 RepID=UPI0036BC2AAD